MSKREADIDIISIAQQARPKLMGHMDDLRAQLTALSSCAKMTPSKPDCSSVGKGRVLINLIMPRGGQRFKHSLRSGARI